MRLDRFLAAWFRTRSRTELAAGIRAGLVFDALGRPLRASATVRAGDVLCIAIPGLAPASEAPPFPNILHEDDRVVVLDKPAGLLAHPAGSDYAWSVIGLAKARWPGQRVDLVHRLDRDTSGLMLLTKDLDANRFLKEVLADRGAEKVYQALVHGAPAWDHAHLREPIGPAGGPIRIQMGVRPDGLSAHTEVAVLERAPGRARVACTLHTGRQHQIRVHLAHAGHALLGDLLYALPLADALVVKEEGATTFHVKQSGGPRQALHAWRLRVPHPSGGELQVEAPLPPDLTELWAGRWVPPEGGAAATGAIDDEA